MLLVLDVGNTNIKAGIYEGNNLIVSWRLATERDKTSDEYGISMLNLFHFAQVDVSAIKGIIVSSVVPSLNYTIEHMTEQFFKQKPLMVESHIKTGIHIQYENPKELGADRIVNAVAAYEYYGGPCVVVDFGTATSFGAITAKGEFLGGAICPGIKISTKALVENAAKLPRIELQKPHTVINKSTVTNMQAGIIYGYVGQVDYIVNKIRKELGDTNARVIATGGLAQLIATESEVINEINPTLTLDGLRILFERNVDLFDGKTFLQRNKGEALL